MKMCQFLQSEKSKQHFKVMNKIGINKYINKLQTLNIKVYKMSKNEKANIIRFEKYMKPSGCCQACLSQAQFAKDCIITCDICRSCIHQAHYGSQLIQPPQVWQCERCRYFLLNGPQDIACQFCPSLRGIMKQYQYENKKIWLHPECALWGYPIIFFVSNKKQGIKKQKPKNQSTYFWAKDYKINQNPCLVCKSMYGNRIKCKYYNCNRSYHVTCARTQGIVRDLQSMKIENGPGYVPVYCKQHIQLKIQDYKKRVRILKQKGDIDKAAHFHKISNLFIEQQKNLQNAVKKCKLQQQMIKRMSLENQNTIGNIDGSFSSLDSSYTSQLSNQFVNFLQQQIIDQQLPVQPIQTIKITPIQPPKLKQDKSNKFKSYSYPKSNQQIIQYQQPASIVSMEIQFNIPPPSNLAQNHKVNSYQQMFQNF